MSEEKVYQNAGITLEFLGQLAVFNELVHGHRKPPRQLFDADAGICEMCAMNAAYQIQVRHGG